MKAIHIYLHRANAISISAPAVTIDGPVTVTGRTTDFIRGELAADRHVGTLYAGHPLSESSADKLKAWANAQGFTMKPTPHVTTAASKAIIDRRKVPRLSGGLVIPAGGRSIQQFGDHLVMCLDCPELKARHAEYKAIGASWDFPSYQPHITIGRAINLPPIAELTPFDEPLTLGPEVQAPFDDY